MITSCWRQAPSGAAGLSSGITGPIKSGGLVNRLLWGHQCYNRINYLTMTGRVPGTFNIYKLPLKGPDQIQDGGKNGQ